MAPRNAKPIDQQLRDAIAKAQKAGTSQYQLAKMAGISASHMQKIADGEVIPQLSTAARVATAIGLKFSLDEA
jgi:predicted transcriptional regulator